ncbi:ROOT HAIR DEFECTIVE 3 homolog 1-like protein [Drosera capensis]
MGQSYSAQGKQVDPITKGRPCSFQMIDGDGNFKISQTDHFLEEVNFSAHGFLYAIVSIIGPQSSGKSTLLNYLFGTNFRVMNASQGRSQTTKGIWLTRCEGFEPCTLVMDLEGTDGDERGEDDTTFEKQSALFALSVSDIMLINICCHDIGRWQAANKPLLENVFQVMMRMLTPRKMTLIFVLRDKTRTPHKKLEQKLLLDIGKIWQSFPKPEAHKDTPFNEFFNVEVWTLANFERERDQFEREVASLRPRFCNSNAPGGLARNRQYVVPASEFTRSAQKIWNDIKGNKDLDLPSSRVLVDTMRCEEKVEEVLCSFKHNKDWCKLEEAARSGEIPCFGKDVGSILDIFLLKYDEETKYTDEEVRSAKRKDLEATLLNRFVEPAFVSVLRNIHYGALEQYKIALDKAVNDGEFIASAADSCTLNFIALFDKNCADAKIQRANWNPSGRRDMFVKDIEAKLMSELKAKLRHALEGPVKASFESANESTWCHIKALFLQETQSMTSMSCLHLLDLDNRGTQIAELVTYAKNLINQMARKEANEVLSRMIVRFNQLFCFEIKRGDWNGVEGITCIASNARTLSLGVLCVMIAVRLTDYEDDIGRTLSSCLLDDGSISGIPASHTWNGIPPSQTLITPIECRSLLKNFWQMTDTIVGTIRAIFIAKEKAGADPKAAVLAIVAGLGVVAIGGVIATGVVLGAPFIAPVAGIVVATAQVANAVLSKKEK